VVDLDTRVFERWRPSDRRSELLSDVLERQPVAAVPPLSIDLVRYCAEVWS
jgi:hypothetical protein